MYYDRQIKYFDYKKDGVRQRGIGFLKAELLGEECDLTIEISGLQYPDAYTGPVYGVFADREEMLGNISLQGGRGSKSLQFVRQSAGQNGKTAPGPAYEDLLAIRVPLGSGCEAYCKIAEQSAIRPEVEKAPVERIPDEVEWPEQDVSAGDGHLSETAEESEQSEKIGEEVCATDAEVAISGAAAPAVAVGYQSGEEKTVSPRPRRMMEEKWEQLWGVYPHLRPFGDSREYLQISPEDFVILREHFYKLVHNSFLLHGFYNYQHLILTRLERRGEVFYYIGVPGNFYDREKQVALMYGFESFECTAEPAGMGDFGYYMIRVEL